MNLLFGYAVFKDDVYAFYLTEFSIFLKPLRMYKMLPKCVVIFIREWTFHSSSQPNRSKTKTQRKTSELSAQRAMQKNNWPTRERIGTTQILMSPKKEIENFWKITFEVFIEKKILKIELSSLLILIWNVLFETEKIV